MIVPAIPLLTLGIGMTFWQAGYKICCCPSCTNDSQPKPENYRPSSNRTHCLRSQPASDETGYYLSIVILSSAELHSQRSPTTELDASIRSMRGASGNGACVSIGNPTFHNVVSELRFRFGSAQHRTVVAGDGTVDCKIHMNDDPSHSGSDFVLW